LGFEGCIISIMRAFIYNKSDLFVALAIIVIAALVIYSRVDAIMGGAVDKELNGAESRPLPTEVAPGGSDSSKTGTDANTDPEQGDVNSGSFGTNQVATPSGVSDPSGDDADANDPVSDPEQPTPADNEPVLFTIEVGANTSTIAKNLAAAGLVPSSDEFLKEVNKQKAETKMKAGTFEIKPGTSVSKIVKILIK
jgi:hypothetical protein